MFDENGERHIRAFISAMKCVADPHRALQADQNSPVVVTGGSPLNLIQLAQFARSASEVFDADVIHLEFEPGREAEGPQRIAVGMFRDGIAQVKSDCQVWADPRGRPFLLARQGQKMGLASFDPEGMDYRPGRPKSDVAKGLARGAKLLRQLAANDLAKPMAKAA
ncbi:MAG: hypothetical protein E7773_11515 [Sphingomonas sp.]|uniref:hypothetical protein n=1 Tax=Sphingomonas sp. TaxID=28214 RepID=UPI00121A1BDD|nr:hypothetical protein [Sphingomonas sp.]THD35082.1 MAG: hypothetical protein E7773_11515 [Sphingomonas sp.]